ncbi:ribonuclease HI [Sulfurospirillum arcachonense]|uniref:ribonuclease HI n=1 Tax=Sulfurospirillum arcachonense TaxID=57666 RepID=UPI00046A48B7|nr:RNase H family protein [Sulfurospirillum arcachonense]
MKQKQLLFTDGSVNPQQNIGFGAYLHVRENDIYNESLKHDIKLKKFENTSSTKLELETLLWALNEISIEESELIVFTDCQNILGLPARREKFEKNSYLSAKNKKISNHELYKEFYKITDLLQCQFIKIKGHKPKKDKDNRDKFFTLVDRASRNALREELKT